MGDENRDPGTIDPTRPDKVATETNANKSHAVRLVDAGSAPRVLLRIDRLKPVKVNVSASSVIKGTIGDKPFTKNHGVRYQLGVNLAKAGKSDNVVARLQATMVGTADSSSQGSTGSWEWRLSPNGVLTKAEPPSVARVDRLPQLLYTPALFLMVPAEPVGPGARWVYPDTTNQSHVEIRLDAVSAQELTASVTMQQDFQDASIVTTATGTWDRHSLIARRVKNRIKVSYKAKTTQNGKKVDLQVLKVVTHEYKQ